MSNKREQKKLAQYLTYLIVVTIVSIAGYFGIDLTNSKAKPDTTPSPSPTVSAESISFSENSIDINKLPEYKDSPFIYINDNNPYFTEADYTTEPFEHYSDLDRLGRCGVAFANICKEIMPTEERTAIGMIKPSGWETKRYNGIVDGNYLYNRCHLIGFQLAGENANEKNLITGTRYMNVEGMLPFEDQVADYIYYHKDNHVLYRVTPIFYADNLVANGVEMEAYSVEDNGEGLKYHVFVYNVQPKIKINYATGASQLIEEEK